MGGLELRQTLQRPPRPFCRFRVPMVMVYLTATFTPPDKVES